MQGVDNDNQAYLECGIRTVDQCDVLLAVWNGKPAAGKGGTADIVAYARELKKPLIWIESTTGERWNERLEQIKSCEVSGSAAAGDSIPIRELILQQYTDCDAITER